MNIKLNFSFYPVNAESKASKARLPTGLNIHSHFIFRKFSLDRFSLGVLGVLGDFI